MSDFGDRHRGTGPGERVPEGTHLDVLLRLEGLARDTSPGHAARVARTLAEGCTDTARVLDRICLREGGPTSGPPGTSPSTPTRKLPPQP